MKTFVKLNFLIAALLLLSEVINVEGLHCYHCASMRSISSNGTIIKTDDHHLPTSFPFTSHPSCAFGEEPDSELSVDCQKEGHLLMKSLGDYKTGNPYAELDEKMVEVANSTRGARFACATIHMTVDKWTETLGNGIVTTTELMTYRTCYPDHWNLKDVPSPFQRFNTTFYTCDLVNNCNGKGNRESYRIFQSPSPDFSGGSKVPRVGYMVMNFLLSIWVQHF